MATKLDLRAELSVCKHKMDSTGVAAIAEWICDLPRQIPRLVELLWDDDAAVSCRAADVLERIMREPSPALQRAVETFTGELIGLLGDARTAKLRWNLALVIPRLALTRPECLRVAATLTGWLEDKSSVVKTSALHGLADLARREHSLVSTVVDCLRVAERSGTPAMRARSRILLKELDSNRKKRQRTSSIHMFG